MSLLDYATELNTNNEGVVLFKPKPDFRPLLLKGSTINPQYHKTFTLGGYLFMEYIELTF